jgi:predicted RNase H-like HicB family nuclease
MMKYAVALEAVPQSENMPGYFYAHIPSLGLTTHGLGSSGALEAAKDLVKLWREEKKVHQEETRPAGDLVLATIEV